MAEENELKQNTLKVRLKHAYKSKDEWEMEANSQLILLEGEFGIESGTNRIKIGNGTTQWKDLPYLTFDALSLEGGMLRGKVTFGDELYYIDNDGTIQFKTIKALAEGGFEGNWNGNAIPVSKGGTGLTTFPANQILVGKGEQGITYLANATAGQILFAQGTNKLPAYQNYFGTTFYNGTSSTYYIADGSGNGYYNALSIGSDRNTAQQSYKFKVSGPSLFDGKIYFTDTSNTNTAGSTPVGIYGSVGTNDGWRIVGLGGSNAGSLEIATCDDGTEPIYIRQYSGGGGSAGFVTIARTLTLLDGSGHTHIPGNLVLNSDVFFQNSATTQMPILKFLKTNDTSNLGVVLSGSGATFVGAGESAVAMGTEKGGNIEDLFLTADRDIYFCTFNEAATVNAKENYGIKMDKVGNFYPLRVRNTTKVTQNLGSSSNYWSNSYIDKMFVGQVEEASKEGLFQNEQSQRIVISPSTNKAVSWLISAYENVSKAGDGTLRVLPKDEFLKIGSIKHNKDEFAAILSMSGHLKIKTLEVENLTSTSTWDTGFIWLSGTAITGQTRGSNASWTIKLGGNNSAHIGNYFQITNKNNEQAFAVFSDTKYVQVTTHLKVGNYTYPKKADGTTDDVKYALATKNFISESWVRTDGNTGWYSEKWSGGWYMIDGTFIRSYNNKQLLIGRNAKSSTALMSGQFIVTSVASGTSTTDLQTIGGDNVAIELWRGANASWQIANESGTFYIRNNYTTSKQTAYSQNSMIMDYNTGAMAVNYLAIAKTGLARDTGYRLYVNGISYLNGNTSVNGNLDLTANHGIIFTATAGGTTTSTPTGLTFGRLQGYGTFAINADTDGSKTEYLILTSGRGMSSSTSDGLTVGYSHVGIFGYSTSYTFYVNGTSYLNGALTLNGTLNLAANLYNGPSGTHGMNCNNSDIIGINGLFTSDNTESFAEGLNFYRSATTFDAMAASGGIFYFGSNKSFGATLIGDAALYAGYLDVSGAAAPTAGRLAGLTTAHARLYGNALYISNPGTTNDQGWIRVLGTGESDTVFEIATGDDGGTGEKIVARQYNTSNAIAKEIWLMDTNGNQWLRSIYPWSNSAYDLGSTSHYWNNAYINYINGLNASTLMKTITITVSGDANTYYPVYITSNTDKSKSSIVSIWKNLGSTTAAYSGNHSSGTSSMWLIYEHRYTGWDGNGGFCKTLYYSMPYANLVAKSQLGTGVINGIIVWLRGGGTSYNISCSYSSFSATPYYNNNTNLGDSTYTSYVSPTTAVVSYGYNITNTYLGYGNIYSNSGTTYLNSLQTTGRIYSKEWIQFDNYTGLYSPNNNAHFYPNNTTTYGQWKILGSKGGYSGIQFGDTKAYMTVMDTSEHKGLFQEDQGRWLFYYQRSTGNVGIRTSSVASYNFNVAGTSYFSDLITATSGSHHKGIKIGNTYINAIDGSLIFQNNTALRFGSDSWDWNVWAGLKYVSANKTIYLGLADSNNFTANSVQTNGTLILTKITNIQDTDKKFRINWGLPKTAYNSGFDMGAIEGLNISQGYNETSGIHFNGDYIAMWSPCDSYALRYFDEDSGNELFNINSSATISLLNPSNTSIKAQYYRTGFDIYNGSTSAGYLMFRASSTQAYGYFYGNSTSMYTYIGGNSPYINMQYSSTQYTRIHSNVPTINCHYSDTSYAQMFANSSGGYLKIAIPSGDLWAAEFQGRVKIAGASQNGTGLGLLVGDDCYIGDCNVANAIGLRGSTTSYNAGIYFGIDGTNGWGVSQPHLIHDQGWGTYNSTYKYSTLRTNARIYFDNAPGNCWIGGGGVDGYSRGYYNNLVISSWYGITFYDTCSNHADITMNVRNGYAYAVSWQSVSDRRAKDDLGEISEKEAFTLLTELKPSLFTFKRDNHNLKKINVGFYAQDLRDILIKHNIGNRDFLSVTLNQNSLLTNEQLEDLGIYANEEDVQYSLDYSKMTPILWKGWQIHEDKISILEKKIEMLEEEIKKLKGDKKIC